MFSSRRTETVVGGLFEERVGALLLVILVAGFGEIIFARMLGSGKLPHPLPVPPSSSAEDFSRAAQPSLIEFCTPWGLSKLSSRAARL